MPINDLVIILIQVWVEIPEGAKQEENYLVVEPNPISNILFKLDQFNQGSGWK